MSDATPWSHLKRLFDQKQYFEAALPGLQTHGLNGEDVAMLLNDPSSELVAWMRAGSGDAPVMLSALEPPADAPIPPRRSGKRGLLGWLSGANVSEGLGLFTESDVFEHRGVQFSVLPEPLRPVVYGDLVPMRVLALNCTSVPLSLSVGIESERGVMQSPRRYLLSLEPGVISMAVLPLRICPSSTAVVPGSVRRGRRHPRATMAVQRASLREADAGAALGARRCNRGRGRGGALAGLPQLPWAG